MRVSNLTAVAALLAVLGACDAGSSGAVGAPCNTAEDCDGELICDEHNGQGSCQDAHGHTASGGSTSDGSTTDDTASTTEPMTTTTDAGSSSTGEPDTDGGSSSSDGGASSESGVDPALCEAFCGCMELTCASYDAYPYADTAACMTACAAFGGAQLQCFGGFCQQAMDSEGTLVEHYCEHAWGELGDEKC